VLAVLEVAFLVFCQYQVEMAGDALTVFPSSLDREQEQPAIRRHPDLQKFNRSLGRKFGRCLDPAQPGDDAS
jgi:hypothetical protein